MVDDRRAAILRAVVQQYIETSQPVSSSHVVEGSDVRASSATVRSEMAALEREGFLRQPHTSAGRVPTDRGYRFFVDHLGAPRTLAQAQQQDVRQFFDRATGEIEQMLHETGVLLSRLTGAAALVVGPDHDATTVRSAQLVSLHPSVVLAVVVLSNGVVDKSTIEVPVETSESTVMSASAALDAHLRDRSLSAARERVPTGDAAVDTLVELALQTLQQSGDQGTDYVYVGGASRVAEAFDAVETVRQVLTILEQQYVVVTLIRDLLDRGMTVSIGTENNLVPLSQCSLVVAPTIVDGEQRGSVAVLGPTRMDYARAMAAVTVVSQRLGQRLSDE